MKIGILGGTFNPPHIGHVILAKDAQKKLGLDKIFFIPDNIPPHKQIDFVDAVYRLEMVKLAIAEIETFHVLNLEIKRGGISYTVDTLREVTQKYPEDEFYLIVGSDLAKTFSTWKNFEEIKKIAKIVIAKRDDFPCEFEEGILSIEITQIDICSSQVRKRIKGNLPINDVVSDKVVRYIEENKLYKNL